MNYFGRELTAYFYVNGSSLAQQDLSLKSRKKKLLSLISGATRNDMYG